MDKVIHFANDDFPASSMLDFELWPLCHCSIITADQRLVFLDLARFDLVPNDLMDVFASSYLFQQ